MALKDHFHEKRVFISGGAGVIGREMVQRLHKTGAQLLVGDLQRRPNDWPDDIQYRQGDLNELSAGELESFNPEIFIHLAASFERSEETYTFWEENFRNNVGLSHHLMSLMKEIASLKRVVFASSYLVYDPALYTFPLAPSQPASLKETARVYPRNLTGSAKFNHEIELRFLENFHKPQFTVLCARIFRGYGKGSRDVISRWIRELIAGREIEVYQKEGMFDYVFAADTAEFLIHLAAAMKIQGIINVGTGKSRRVASVLQVLHSHFPDMKYREVNSNLLFEAAQADITLLQNSVEYVAQYSLERGIAEIIAFEKRKIDQEEQKPGNVLMTSSSTKVPMYRAVKKAAAKLNPSIHVCAGDSDPNAISRYISDEFWMMPQTMDENLSTIIAECQKRGISWIIPSRDGELLFWARHRSTLQKQGIHVMVSDEKVVQTCIDKYSFYRFCVERKIPAILTWLNEIPLDVVTDRFVVKERFGAASQGVAMNVTREEAMAHGRKLQAPIYQPFVNGVEMSIDAYRTRTGELKGVVMRERSKIVNGESQVTTVLRDHPLEERMSHILSQFDFYGHVIAQAFVLNNNQILLNECNCRFGGASTASIHAGLDSFYWFLLESTGVDIRNYPFVRTNKAFSQVRVKDDVFIHGTDF